MRIRADAGGQIGPYLQELVALRGSGERVIIDGPCLSACTMVLGVIPRERICVTARARLGFHAAWHPGDDGRPVTVACRPDAIIPTNRWSCPSRPGDGVCAARPDAVLADPSMRERTDG